MPVLGLGLFQIPEPAQAQQTVENALALGYRLIDTASAYYNEAAVGRAIKNSSVPRSEIFVTTKLWVNQMSYQRAQQGIDQSLAQLGLDYLDLCLIHQPYGDLIGAWRALSEARRAGKVRSIGVSNFTPDRLLELELMSGIKPAVNQIEVSPWFQQPQVVAYTNQRHVQVEAWAPFAEGQHQIFQQPLLVQIAAKHQKTVGQVILRWLLQRGIVTIPKSVHRDRLAENIAVFDFQLTTDEMKQIASLDKGVSQFFDHRDPVAIENIAGASLRELQHHL